MAVKFESQAEPIPGYTLVDRLGSGGFGEVWKAVAPGGIMTPLVEGTPAGFPDNVDLSLFGHLTPMTRFGTPENVAGVIAMLASEDGAHMTGEIVRIDGGVHS